MPLLPWFRSRAVPADVPLDDLADAIAEIRTARIAYTWVFDDARGRDYPVTASGIRDHVNHLIHYTAESTDDRHQHLIVGADVLHRLSPQEQQETGKVWRWEQTGCSYFETEQEEEVAAIRHIAHPVASEVETIDGVQHRRYTLRIKPRRGETIPALVNLHNHFLHQHKTDQAHYDIWTTTDGQVTRIRVRQDTVRWHRGIGKVRSTTAEYWDFGVSVDLRAPTADEVIPRQEDALA